MLVQSPIQSIAICKPANLLLIWLFVLSLCTISLQAQDITTTSSRRLGVGLVVGVSQVAPIWVPNTFWHFPTQYTMIVGLEGRYRIGERSFLVFQPSWTNVKYSNLSNVYWWRPELTMNTLKLPLLYRYRIFPTKLAPFIELGGAYNQALSGAYQEQLPCDLCIPTPENTITERYTVSGKSAVSLMAGAGISIPLNRMSIPIAVRYERYVSSHTFTGTLSSSNPNLQFESVSLLTGITF